MNLAELNAQIAAAFDAYDGPARAFFEVPAAENEGTAVVRVNYETVLFGVLLTGTPKSSDELEADLCQAFWHALPVTPDGVKPILFWRTRPAIAAHKSEGREPVLRIRARLAIPGYKLKPGGDLPIAAAAPTMAA